MRQQTSIPQPTARQRVAVTVRSAGGPDVLEARPEPMPVAGVGELVVEMQAAGVAFGDVTQRQGRNPARMPPVLGYDVVGVVTQVGPGAGEFVLGQRVAALTMVGGYASHVLVTSKWAVAVRDTLDAAQVSALTLNYLTAWQMLHRVAHVQSGQSILVLGAAGGVGSALTELAALAGVRVYGTASARRQEILRARGVIVVPDAESVPERVDATFDPVGGPSLARSRRATKRSGMVVAFGFSFVVDAGHSRGMGLARATLGLVTSKLTPGARVVTFLIPASAAKDPAAIRADLAQLGELLADGALHPVVETMPLSHAADAHRKLENRQVTGKLVLIPG